MKKVYSFSNVKWKNHNAMGHEEGGVADQLADGDSISPKDERSHADPL